MKVKRYGIVMLVILLCLTAIGGCAVGDEVPEATPEATTQIPLDELLLASGGSSLNDYILYTFSETVEYSSHIVDAEFLGAEGRKLHFKVTNIYKGSIENPDSIYVHRFDWGYGFNMVSYDVGSTYMLCLTHHPTVYKEDCYSQTGRFYLPERKDIWDRVHQEIVSMMQDSKYSAAMVRDGDPYTTSAELGDGLEVANCIYVVRPDEKVNADEFHGTELYRCKLLKTLRNRPSVRPKGKEIYIDFFEGTVEAGKEYVVLLSNADLATPNYSLASPNSIFTIEEAESIPELKQLLANGKDY